MYAFTNFTNKACNPSNKTNGATQKEQLVVQSTFCLIIFAEKFVASFQEYIFQGVFFCILITHI